MGVLPKTTVPDALRPLPAVLAECGRLPLWVAGTLVYALGRDRAEQGTPVPAAPGDVLLDGRGQHRCLAAISRADGPYAAPEEHLLDLVRWCELLLSAYLPCYAPQIPWTGGAAGERAMRFTKMQGLGNDYVYLNCTGGLPDKQASNGLTGNITTPKIAINGLT